MASEVSVNHSVLSIVLSPLLNRDALASAAAETTRADTRATSRNAIRTAHQVAGDIDRSRQTKSRGCHRSGTPRTTATRGCNSEGRTLTVWSSASPSCSSPFPRRDAVVGGRCIRGGSKKASLASPWKDLAMGNPSRPQNTLTKPFKERLSQSETWGLNNDGFAIDGRVFPWRRVGCTRN
jgi:hypothetical protein